mmetsp:Transcript_165990/g.532851  ORF Transcript_165990/g.532851 Transcript_165990/m.532851 type:complete len:281 (+) Transcript_165990:73-915(+)
MGRPSAPTLADLRSSSRKSAALRACSAFLAVYSWTWCRHLDVFCLAQGNRHLVTGAHRRSPGCPLTAAAAEEGGGGSGGVPQVKEEEEDFYAVLGVNSHAPVVEIKAGYRKASRESHPDLVRGSKEELEVAAVRFAKVSEAFRVLSDKQLRETYDLRGLAGVALFEFNGERIIMPPPWRVRIAHTGHHFWKREEYFVGLLAEIVIDLSIADIRRAYAEATKDPPGTGQAVLVEKCVKNRAEDLVELLGEYGLMSLAEEIEDDDEDEAPSGSAVAAASVAG